MDASGADLSGAMGTTFGLSSTSNGSLLEDPRVGIRSSGGATTYFFFFDIDALPTEEPDLFFKVDRNNSVVGLIIATVNKKLVLNRI